MNATDLLFLKHCFHSLALSVLWGGGLLLSNIMNKVINIILIIWSSFIIIEFGTSMSLFLKY